MVSVSWKLSEISLKSEKGRNDLNYVSGNSVSRNLYKYVLKSLNGNLTAWHRIEISER
jgi:hypothetical protein